jgi:hypothetical protein
MKTFARLVVLASVLGSTATFAQQAQPDVWSSDAVIILGQSFTPSYNGGAGSGNWQFVVGGQTNWAPGTGGPAGTEVSGIGWSSSWTPSSGGSWGFWIAKCGDNDWQTSNFPGPYTIRVDTPPRLESVSADNTSPGQATTITARATDPDGNLSTINVYVNPPNWSGWQYIGSISATDRSDITGSIQWTPPADAMTGTWTAHARGIDKDGAWDSNGGQMFSFFVKHGQSVSSSPSSVTVGDSFTPSYYGGGGSGPWQFVVGGQTNWGGNQEGTLLSPNNTPSTSWSSSQAGQWGFWIHKLGDNDYYDSDPSGPYDIVVNPPPDNSPPSMPDGLSAWSVATDSFTFGWNASSDNVGVAAYEVACNGVSLGEQSGTSMTLTGLAAGTTYAMTTRARDAAYNWSAWSSALTVTTERQNQTISFGALANHLSTDPAFTVSATASSGLPVSFSIISGAATINGNTVSLTGGTGVVTVRALQSGNSVYAAATPVDQSFTVSQGSQTPVISAPSSISATLNQSFSYVVPISGTVSTLTATGLPAGLTIDPASHVIGGTPGANGVFNTTIAASNSYGTATVNVEVVIEGATLEATEQLMNVGATTSFTAKATHSAGINEIGIEQCSEDGSFVSTLSTTSVSNVVDETVSYTWSPTTPGSYYFRTYAWDTARAQKIYSDPLPVMVGTTEAQLPDASPKPGVIVVPSARVVVAGDPVTFTVTAFYEAGLSRIGLRECRQDGTPISTLGDTNLSESYGEQNIGWTPPTPGVYYFQGFTYATGSSTPEQTAPLAITVIDNNYNSTGTDDGDDWGDDDWGGDEWGGDGCGFDTFGTSYDITTPSGHWYTIQSTGQVIRHTSAGDFTFTPTGISTWSLSTPGGASYSIARADPSNGGASTGVSVVTTTTGQSYSVAFNGTLDQSVIGPINVTASDGSQIVRLAPFIVSGNNSETFDWTGYYNYLADRGIAWWNAPNPVNFLGGSTYTGRKGALGDNYYSADKFPFTQTTNTSCGVAVARNIIALLTGSCTLSEKEIATRMMASIGAAYPDLVADFVQAPDGADMTQYGVKKMVTEFNAALNPQGIQVGQAHVPGVSKYEGLDEFKTLMQNAATQGTLFIAQTFISNAPGAIGLDGNHVVVMQPHVDNGVLKVTVIDSGRPKDGYASVSTYVLSNQKDLLKAATTPMFSDITSGPNANQPISGSIFPVSKMKPPQG